MTIEELYQLAKNRGFAHLPIYAWSEKDYEEREVCGYTRYEAEDEGLMSDCCSAPTLGETDICSECKEHADFAEGLPERVVVKY